VRKFWTSFVTLGCAVDVDVGGSILPQITFSLHLSA